MKDERVIESLFQAYKVQLDSFVLERCPSLSAIYDRLSEALHRADEGEEIFAKARNDTLLHFEGLQMISRIKS